MLPPPDNFLYFITLFSLAVFGGTYLLFTYYINRLLVINAVILFLAATRIASEFYIQQLDTYEQVVQYAPWHILPVNILMPMMWALVWLYIRPVKDWRREKIINHLVVFGAFILPFVGHNHYCSINPQLYSYHTERIDGYWQFAVNSDFWYYYFYRKHSDTMLLIITIVLLIGVIKNKEKRLRQSFLVASYIVMPIIYYSMTKQGQWNIPATGIVYLSHTLIISWYVSNYRLFRSNINLITKDLFESISDLTISTNPQLAITNVNTKTSEVFKVDTKNIINWLKKKSADSKQDIPREINRLLQQDTEDQELQLLDKEDRIRIFSLKVAPFSNGEDLLGYTFLMTDLTDIRATEKKLEESNNTKDRLFAIIGHDLRKPALAFRGIGKKINYLISKKDSERLLSFGDELEKEAASLNSLLDNLLNWAMQQRGTMLYRPKRVLLADVIKEIEQSFGGVATSKGVDLIIDVATDTCVFADRNAVVTIIRNLIDNAIKFTPENGQVTLTEEVRNEEVIIKITDTGIGIPAAEMDKLFKLDGQKSRNGTAGEKGTGLGLSLTNELVNLNKGHISVDSQPAVGTTFKVTLPAT